MFSCPQCACDTPTLHEGVCEECRMQNQSELDEHNVRFDQWQSMTDAERDTAIRNAMG